MNYKHIRSNQVISQACYNKLTQTQKYNFIRTYDDVTHTVREDSEDGMLDAIIVGAVIGELLSDDDSDSGSSFSDSIDSGSSDSDGADLDFGGGEGGGAGAGGDF